jgi:hypothetical protein
MTPRIIDESAEPANAVSAPESTIEETKQPFMPNNTE